MGWATTDAYHEARVMLRVPIACVFGIRETDTDGVIEIEVVSVEELEAVGIAE
jgi:hypothetical protein